MWLDACLMSVEVRILPCDGLVVVRYTGTILVSESVRAFSDYLDHPDFAPGQKHLIDLTDVTGFETDYVKIMQMQARKAAAFVGSGAPSLMVYLAPRQDTLGLAQLVARSWDSVAGVTALVQQDEARALSLLGIEDCTIADLMARAG
ncbi:MAG: hypothetical protein AAGM84_03775 [Pseudomonadota bacterium]